MPIYLQIFHLNYQYSLIQIDLLMQSVDSGSSTRTEVNMISSLMSLYESSPTNIMNRAVVIHEKADDLGRGDSPQSLKNGNTGTIVACALITPVKEFPRDVEHSRRGHHTGVKDFKSTTTTKRDSLELESPVSTHKGSQVLIDYCSY